MSASCPMNGGDLMKASFLRHFAMKIEDRKKLMD